MKSWGAMFFLIGLGSFVFPLVGMQFKLINVFGDSHVLGGVLCAMLGGVLILTGLAKDQIQAE